MAVKKKATTSKKKAVTSQEPATKKSATAKEPTAKKLAAAPKEKMPSIPSQKAQARAARFVDEPGRDNLVPKQ